jgi:hypothetical protein
MAVLSSGCHSRLALAIACFFQAVCDTNQFLDLVCVGGISNGNCCGASSYW